MTAVQIPHHFKTHFYAVVPQTVEAICASHSRSEYAGRKMQIWIKMSRRRPWGTAGENNVYVGEIILKCSILWQKIAINVQNYVKLLLISPSHTHIQLMSLWLLCSSGVSQCSPESLYLLYVVKLWSIPTSPETFAAILCLYKNKTKCGPFDPSSSYYDQFNRKLH